MNIAILMMQKNEDELLSKWVTYHSYLVGSSNLFIYDNGSTNKQVINQLKDHEKKEVNVFWNHNKKTDYEQRGTLFYEKIKELDKKGLYDFYMLVDCDEFLGVVDEEGNISCEPLSLQYSLLNYQNSNELLMIDSQYYNSSISSLWFNKQPYRKCFFRKNTILQLDQGFHHGKVTTSQKELRTNLIHIHFHNKPYEIAKRHAKEKLTGRVADFNLDTLKSYKGRGFHLVRFFLQTENEYISTQVALNHIKSASLYYKLNQLNMDWPFNDDIAESKNKLSITDDDMSFKKVLPKFRGSVDFIGFENDCVKIRGWGLVNYSRPIKHIFLEFEGDKRLKFDITERKMREDVNEMLNVKGVTLGFSAKLNHSDLKMFKGSPLGATLVTFLDSEQCFFQFDMLKKNKEFDYFAFSELVG
jgi:hypothetical protein